MDQRINKRFNVAIIGCGCIAGNHLNGVLKSNCNLVALCDNVAEKANKLAAKYNVTPKIYTNYLEMLDSESLDAIHICTPHYLHAPMILEALKRNIHVLCEKPLCISMEQMEQIVKATKHTKATLGVCLQNRYDGNMLWLKDFLQDKEILDATGIVIWNRDANYYRHDAWRGTLDEEGGGVMINQALHTLDLLQWMAGTPDKVTAHTYNDHLKNIIEVEDTATALFSFHDSNKLLHFYATNSGCADYPTQLQFVYKDKDGKKHSIFADYDKVIVDCSVTTTKEEREKIIGKQVWGSGHAHLIQDFYYSLRNGIPFAIQWQDAFPVLSMIFGMYESSGNTIPLNTLS